MAYCSKCGRKLKKRDQFCKKCGTPVNAVIPVQEVRQEPVFVRNDSIGIKVDLEEYYKVKSEAVSLYQKQMVSNPFAPAGILRDKWNEISNQLNNAYTLSQANPETIADGPELMQFAEDARKRSDSYEFETGYEDFKSEFLSLCKDYRALIDEECSWDDESELLQRFESLHQRMNILADRYKKYSQLDIDWRLFRDIQSNIAFYYCVQLLFEAENERRANRYYAANQYEVKCSGIASAFSDDRFMILAANAFYRQSLNAKKLEDQGIPMIDSRSVVEIRRECINKAESYMSPLENVDYCSSVIARHYEGSYLNTWEWLFLDYAVNSMVKICEFKHNYRKRKKILNIAIDALNRVESEEEWRFYIINRYTVLRDTA